MGLRFAALDRNDFKWNRHSDPGFCFVAILSPKTAHTFRHIALVLALLAIPLASGAKALFQADFQRHAEGPYSREQFISDWGIAPSQSTGVEAGRVHIVADPAGSGRHVLRVTYAANQIGGNSAMTFSLPIEKGHRSVWFQYKVMFDKAFIWVRGGKLPGLAGGDFPTGCVKNGSFDGFSTRLMWRNQGLAYSYLYFPGKREVCGDDYVLPVKFKPGRWYTLSQRVTLNDPGKANGSLSQYIDGVLVAEIGNMAWRQKESSGIDGVKMDTFFGGGEMDWAPPSDQYAYFDRFVVTTDSPLATVDTRKSTPLLTRPLAGYAAWSSADAYDKAAQVYLKDKAGHYHHYTARMAVTAGTDPAQSSLPDIYEGVHWPLDLDKGQPWLERTED